MWLKILEGLRWDDPTVQRLVTSLVALLVIYGLVFGLGQVLGRALKDPRWRHKSRRFLFYLGTFLALLVLFGIWSGNVGQFALTVSVIGAGLALALQQPIVSLAGWLFIVITRPYDVGDRIEVGGVAGDVIDIRLFKTVLLEIYAEGAGRGSQSTGRVVDVPNGRVFTETVVNYTRGFEYLWNEYPITITFESNWEKAKRLLEEIVRKHTAHFEEPARRQIERMARSYLIQYGALTPAVFVTIRDSGVELALRYLTPARQRRLIRDAISQDVLRAFEKEPDIELAYPTFRVFRREIEEGKLALRGRELSAPPPDRDRTGSS